MLLQDAKTGDNDDLETIAESLPSRPRSVPMRTIALNIGAPLLAVAMVSLTWAYPSASDFVAAMAPVQVQTNPVGATDVRRIVTDIADALPTGAEKAISGSGDCFDDPSFANADKRTRCGRVVYDALIAIDTAAKTNTDMMGNTPEARQAVERLKYVATEVCRTAWSNGVAGKGDYSPACKVSNIDIALASK